MLDKGLTLIMSRTGPGPDDTPYPPPSAGRSILLGAAAGPDGARAAASLTRRGWTVTTASDGARVVARAATGDFALLLLRGTLPVLDGATLAARISRVPPPRGLMPVLMTAGDRLPSDAALLSHVDGVLRSGTPPVDVLTRFAPLFGTAGIGNLLLHFRNRLGALIAAPNPYAIDEGADAAALAHRMTGLAGMLDFAVLAAAWRRVELDGPAHLSDAWVETRIAYATLNILLDRRIIARHRDAGSDGTG
jgi:CheY-like chemotaxis protein